MSGSFQLVALPYEPFRKLFERSDEELAALGARSMTVDEKPGFPCRVSLKDGEVGETVVLLSYAHHDVDTPYRGTGPIFVRKNAEEARLAPGEIPEMLWQRLLSVRAYDAQAMLVASTVIEGSELDATIRRLFEDRAVSYLHLHNAKPGCYNCCVVRA